MWNKSLTVTPVAIVTLRKILKCLKKKAGRTGIERKNRDHPKYSIGVIGQNTAKSPGGLRRLAVTQTPVKSHQLTLM